MNGYAVAAAALCALFGLAELLEAPVHGGGADRRRDDRDPRRSGGNGRLGAAAAIGSLPPALAYALAGAFADSFGHPRDRVRGVLTLAGLAYLATR